MGMLVSRETRYSIERHSGKAGKGFSGVGEGLHGIRACSELRLPVSSHIFAARNVLLLLALTLRSIRPAVQESDRA